MGQHIDNLKALCVAKGLNYVGTRGNTRASVAFIAEAPGEKEDAARLPLVGPSGKLADAILDEVGFKKDEIWFTNPYRVRPPDNDLNRLSETGTDYSQHEAAFWEELEEYKPTIIITAGAVSTTLLLPHLAENKKGEAKTVKLSKWRGNICQSPLLSWPHYVIPCYHPAYLFSDYSERDVTKHAIGKAYDEYTFWKTSGTLNPLPTRSFNVDGVFDDTVEFLLRCLASPRPISVDIETLRRKYPFVVGLAINPTEAIAIELCGFSDLVQRRRIWRLLDEVFRTKRQIGQNYTVYDVPYLQALGFRPNLDLIDDTLIRHHVLWPELPHSLQFQTMQYTRETYYKDEGKSWSVKKGGGGKRQLKIYNCKDTCATYEIYEAQEGEFNDRPYLRRSLDKAKKPFDYETYEMPLARHFVNVDKRGIMTDPVQFAELRKDINADILQTCGRITQTVGRPVVRDKETAEKISKAINVDIRQFINLGAPKQVIDMLLALGLKVPKKDGRYTSNEDALTQMFAETSHPVLKEILHVREYNKILDTYVNARLWDNVLYCSYIVAGTVTGRRSSRANAFGLGTNHQNIAKHSALGKRLRGAFIARPDKIFVSCDQVQAEDWIVQGLIADISGDRRGLDELLKDLDRHARLASFIFNLPLDQCGKDTPQRYMGKKTRHAGNYGMQGKRMSVILANEGFAVSEKLCDGFLYRFHQYDPGIQKVFHAYVEKTLRDTRTLHNLFGRERMFFGLRPFGSNADIFREAYSYIPQSTVGDNTGLALQYCEENALPTSYVVSDTHDALTMESDDNIDAVWDATQLLARAFDRVITFPNGLTVKIPIEFEIGYDSHPKHLATIKCANLTRTGLQVILNTLHRCQSPQPTSISGLPQQSSEQPLNVVSG